MLKTSLCDYGAAYIIIKGNITVNNTMAAGAAANNSNKKVVFKNCAPFTDSISEINNTKVDNAKYTDIVMPVVNNDGDIVDINGANATDSFNFKAKITGQTNDDGEINNVEIMVPLKYLSRFWRTLEIPLINFEVNIILTWSEDCVIVYTNVANWGATFAKIETKLYVPVVTLSAQDNAKLLPQLKSGFKRKINWNT